jgi:hypothetical protein
MMAYIFTDRSREALFLLTLLCAASLVPFSGADEPPLPPARQVRLESGRVIEYTSPFDRNSLQDSVRVGNSLIALTSSGVLLRFQLPDVRLVQGRAETVEVKCLGRGEGNAILAALTDGGVCRVDPATLELTEVAKLPAPPRWVGWLSAATNRPAGLVVVTGSTKSTVHDLATQKSFTLEHKVTTALLDTTGRLWLGADNGEWGGRVTRVDLTKGTIAAIDPPPSREPRGRAFWNGIYGFIELRDRQVWAYGGTSHMGLDSRNVARIDEDRPRPIFERETHVVFEGEPGAPQRALPITHIIEENESLLVFSYDDVYRVDKTLRTWKQFATLSLQYRWGRPDAMGSYPSLCAVHPPSRDGDPYILATSADGYVLLNGAKTTAKSLPGQLGADGIDLVMNTAEGTLFFEEADPEDGDALPPWTLSPSGWNLFPLELPAKDPPPKQAIDEDDDSDANYVTHVLVDPSGGEIYIVTGTGRRGGTLTTVRRVAGKTAVLGRESSSLEPRSCFVTAGTLWHAAFGELKRFENGKWKTVLPLPDAKGRHQFRSINQNGPPWLLLDNPHHTLWRLDHGAHAENPRLTRLELRESAKLLQTSAAIPWSNGSLLLSTDQGLRLFDSATGKVTKVDFPQPPQAPDVLARDGLGRFWLGGEHGLWLVDPAEKTLESLDRVPSIQHNEVRSLAPDPHHDDGMIAALGPNGVAFLRAPRKP